MFSKILVPQILIIEKNEQIFDILISCIGSSDIEIERVNKIKNIADKSLSKYSLIIADLDLKDKNSLSCIKYIREKSLLSPVIILGENLLENKILSYQLGINIYHEKPIRCELLKAQIKHLSLLFQHSILIDLGILKIDTASKGIILESDFIPLTSREFNLLMLLVRSGGRVLSPKRITSLSPCGEGEITESAIHTIVSRIRSKLKDKIPEPLILTRHQAGYGINHHYLQNLRLRMQA